jgi:Uma2 family endonuclease
MAPRSSATIERVEAEHRLRMGYDDWLAWFEHEGNVGEWVDGEVIVFMPPVVRHQLVSTFLVTLLNLFVTTRGLGMVLAEPFEMRLAAGRISRLPDILFLATRNLDRLDGKRLAGPADLVVEILSDDSVSRDRQRKMAEYATAGVEEYWIVDPRAGRETTEFYDLAGEGRYDPIAPDADGLLRSKVLPGFWLDPAWLTHDPLPAPLPLLLQVAPDALG